MLVGFLGITCMHGILLVLQRGAGREWVGETRRAVTNMVTLTEEEERALGRIAWAVAIIPAATALASTGVMIGLYANWVARHGGLWVTAPFVLGVVSAAVLLANSAQMLWSVYES